MRRHETETETKRTLEEAAQRPTVFSFTQRVTTHLYIVS
jgi:hypothetical protein